MTPSTFGEADYARLRDQMVERQLRRRGVAAEAVLQAMRRVPRHRFVGASARWAAYDDEPLPIGSGQTISQPFMVARMTELLELDGSSHVLEVGTGSGYQAAVLAEIARDVWTIERHSRLAGRARALLAELGYSSVHVVVGDGSLGLPQQAPFDAIVVTAGAPYVPGALLDQLAVGGRLVIPVGGAVSQRLRLIRRGAGAEDGTGEYTDVDVLGCRFVPLIGAQAHSPRDSQRVHVLVEGRVQGVWFRESMRAEAERLGVHGWVRNLSDGRVEAVFEGESGAVDAMVEWTHRGPERARVTAVVVEPEQPRGEDSFQVTG
ncbi:MAG: protein-L-isoaspartate(D-aspartate) O-methyltransferase [Thermoleophilia bacterium]